MAHIPAYYKGKEFKIHKLLADNLDILRRANKQDWDFKLLISGSGMTRTGKSTLGSQIAVYVDPTANLDRVIFRGDKLIEKSLSIGKNKVLIYDEAREGLESKKAMRSYSQNILDYFSECGWLNQYLIIILPDFFDLNKTIALNQSVFLLNCKIRKGFYRGYFDFHSRKSKRYLYIKGKKFNNYFCQYPTFNGTFTKYFPFDMGEYEKRKIDNQRMMRDKEKKDDPVNQLDRLIYHAKNDGVTMVQLAKWVKLDQPNISRRYHRYKKLLEADL